MKEHDKSFESATDRVMDVLKDKLVRFKQKRNDISSPAIAEADPPDIALVDSVGGASSVANVPAPDTMQQITISPAASIVLKSIGYKCEPVSTLLPFDRRSNTMPHSQGRVRVLDAVATNSAKYEVVRHGDAGTSGAVDVVKGLYVAGWLKRGPTGIVGSNIGDAKETVASVLADLQAGEADAAERPDPVISLLPANHFSGKHAVVDWAGHLRIDAEEVRRGQSSSPPKEREKLLNRDEMVSVAQRER